jgi:3-hydroxyacyl-CoA dehydrogenase
LLEIVRGQATADDVIASVFALSRKLGKIGVLAGNCRGFIGNRMIHVYGREAQFLVEEGATVEQVNQALYDFGMPMGPLAMFDLVGNDVMAQIAAVFTEQDAPGTRQPRVLPQLVRQGRFGQKSGRGWSAYDANRKPSPDAETAALIVHSAREAAIPQRHISKEEIVDRCIFALVNEGARILAEGMALRASDIDVVYLTGYGFPAWRGGPMFYAGTVGLPAVAARIAEFRGQHGAALWPLASLLEDLAANHQTFTST